MSTERARIAMLQRLFGNRSPGVTLGVGDDAAILDAVEANWICSVDAAVENVHFRREWVSFEQLGYRATMAALSDLAAMGAAPRGVLSSLVVPDDVGDADLEQLAHGQKRATEEVGTVVCGGNLARGAELAIHTTVLGTAVRPLRRDGSRAGDAVFLVGANGLAAAGLEFVRGQDGPGESSAIRRRSLEAWREPRAKIEQGLEAAAVATGAIDLSDGLASDASHLALASGIALVLDDEKVVEEEVAAAAAALGVEPLELALYGGEDYALLLTAPAAEARAAWRMIGRCVAAGEQPPGVYIETEGTLEAVVARGFDHFAG